MKHNLIKILSLLFIVIWVNSYSLIARAGGVESLMKYASPEGTMSNVTKGAIVKDQQGGYMTGGSVILRGPRPQTLQPLVIQTPKLAYDACTGSADFRFGGLSYIASKEFTEFFKKLGTATGAYAVKMFIKSACPQCEDIMSYLETIARDINGLMMDQCSTSQAIAGGIYNTLTSASQQKCMMQGNIHNTNKDMYEATDQCKTNPDRHGNKGEEDELKSLLGNEFNLVWKALGKDAKNATDFKELIMSISGTIIGRKVDGSFHFTNKPSMVLSNDLLERYIGVHKGSSKVKLYVCDSKDKCLSPQEKEITLQAKDTIYGNVSRILETLVPKILEGKPQLTDEEEMVVAFSSIPLIPLIEMEIVSKAKIEDMSIRTAEFLEVVCYDVVTNFLAQMVTQSMSAVGALEYAQLDDRVIKNFTAQITEVRRFITDSKFAAFKRLQVITQVKERLVQQQKSFGAGYSRFVEHSED